MRKYMTLVVALAALGLPGRAGAEEWTALLKDDLRHWQSSVSGEEFRVKAGTLTVDGPGQIVYAGDGKPLDLRDLELRAEVLTKPGGRAGLTFHIAPNPRSSGGVEVRLDNSYSSPGSGHGLLKTGSLVWLRPVVKSVVPEDRWFNLHVTVRGPRVQVRVNKQLVMDYVEPEKMNVGPRLKRGTVAVRGHGGTGAVLIRKLEVRPIPEGTTSPPAPAPDATDLRLARLREQGFLPVDYHARLTNELTPEGVLAHSWRTGIGAAVVVPCGKGFRLSDDKEAEKFLTSVAGRPVLVGMHAEGREWVRLFSPATVARFDYVFTDAMTLIDERGRRMRLRVKDEVNVPDPQAFMDRLVKTIETILDREPIDFYANPTYLPEVLAKDYDRLWTPERQRRVVEALARNGVALEINDTLRLPKPALIKKAKEAGVKFTFGTNNADRRLGRLEYCLQMIEECALTPDDLWAPKPSGEKPIQARKR